MELPGILLESLNQVKGFDLDAFVQAHQAPPPVSVRFNPKKTYSRIGLELDKTIPWTSQGFYLKERPIFTLDPALHAGAYYVQEASSMFIEFALEKLTGQDQGLRVVDLCAAPGGKTTLLASMPQFSLVVANEIIRTRVNILYENVVKWGDPRIIVSNNDPSAFSRLPDFFDVMVVDAPCSGSGLFRKDPDALKEWSLNNVQLCSERQKRILADAMPALKDGGYLLYSTCSYSKEEDEDIMDWILASQEFEPVDLDIPGEWGIQKTKSIGGGTGFRFFPGSVQGEGFFLACFRRTRTGPQVRAYPDMHHYENKPIPASYGKLMEPWVDFGSGISMRQQNDEIFLLPGDLQHLLPELEGALSLRKKGVRAGAVIRDSFIPDHELVLSYFLRGDAPSITLNAEDALRFLRKQDFQPSKTDKGWYVMRYDGLALGLIKHLGNRLNNYYPASWRILMS